MKSNSADNIHLTSVEDLFNLGSDEPDSSGERVKEIPLSELFSFKDHPFQVRDDDEMRKTVESIQKYGVLTPAIARPRAEGGYELISGHRRKRGSELAGKDTMPVIVRDLDDDAATIIMVDTNLQRESLLPSERAYAYKMKLDAMNHQGARTDLSSSQLGTKKRSDEILAEQVGESRNQIQRYIRLTELNTPLLDMVDIKKVALNTGVELSYLKDDEQWKLSDVIKSEDIIPSQNQAKRLKQLSQEGRLTEESMLDILTEGKKEQLKITISTAKVRQYFPHGYTPGQMERVIVDLLENWRSNNPT